MMELGFLVKTQSSGFNS